MITNNTKKQSVKNLITLCHIIDEFFEFHQNFINLISSTNKDDIYKLNKISNGKFVPGARKVKKFYKQNKYIIETIKKYSDISTFINSNYNFKTGSLREDSDLYFFYQYILDHKNDLVKILSVLNKTKELDIDKLEFDSSLDFTKNEYKLDIPPGFGFNFFHLDNIEIIPTYQLDVIEYKTTGSNYEICAKVIFYDFSKSNKTIIVNSLLFDSNRLPKDFSYDTIFGTIVELKAKEEVCAAVKSSVDLSVSIDNLYQQFNFTSLVIKNLDNIETKVQLKDELLNIKKSLDQLKRMSSEYDDSISKTNQSITKKHLQKEKQKYLQRTSVTNLDTD